MDPGTPKLRWGETGDSRCIAPPCPAPYGLGNAAGKTGGSFEDTIHVFNCCPRESGHVDGGVGAAPDGFLGLAEGSTRTLPRLLWVFQPAELSLSIRLSALSCSAASPAPSAGQGVRTRGITAWQEMLKQRLEEGISSWRPLLGHWHS